MPYSERTLASILISSIGFSRIQADVVHNILYTLAQRVVVSVVVVSDDDVWHSYVCVRVCVRVFR